MTQARCPVLTYAVNSNEMGARAGGIMPGEGRVSGMMLNPCVATWRLVHPSKPYSGVVFALIPS